MVAMLRGGNFPSSSRLGIGASGGRNEIVMKPWDRATIVAEVVSQLAMNRVPSDKKRVSLDRSDLQSEITP
jgi:hypothetical protein